MKKEFLAHDKELLTTTKHKYKTICYTGSRLYPVKGRNENEKMKKMKKIFLFDKTFVRLY